jgi:hypothetical protein
MSDLLKEREISTYEIRPQEFEALQITCPVFAIVRQCLLDM